MIQSKIKSFIGDQSAELDSLDQGFNSHGVEAMARQQFKAHQIAQGIGESQDFRRHPTFDLPMAWL